MFTVKDQSGGIYNSYSTGGQEFMAVVSKPTSSSGYVLLSIHCHKSLALCYNHTSNSRECMGVNGEALQLHSVYKKPYFLLQVT